MRSDQNKISKLLTPNSVYIDTKRTLYSDKKKMYYIVVNEKSFSLIIFLNMFWNVNILIILKIHYIQYINYISILKLIQFVSHAFFAFIIISLPQFTSTYFPQHNYI
jgi:hypothetical protein